MTAVGKILVILNLLFSLAVGGFLAMDFATRANWREGFEKANAQYQIAQASEASYKAENEKVIKDRDAQVALVKDQLKKVQADLAQQVTINDQLRKDATAQDKKYIRSDTTVQAGQMEIVKRQAEHEKMKQMLKDADAANNKLVLEKNALQDRAVAAEIQMKAAVDRAQRMEAQVQDLTKDLVRMRSGGGASTAARAGAKNPPPDNIEGLIRTTDPSSNLVTITIGSDAGLSKGHTLEVFRLSSIPQQSKYLGTIRILEVTPTQAVGQPVGRMTTPPQPGDRVASHILGG
jgi:hypothetical protein